MGLAKSFESEMDIFSLFGMLFIDDPPFDRCQSDDDLIKFIDACQSRLGEVAEASYALNAKLDNPDVTSTPGDRGEYQDKYETYKKFAQYTDTINELTRDEFEQKSELDQFHLVTEILVEAVKLDRLTKEERQEIRVLAGQLKQEGKEWVAVTEQHASLYERGVEMKTLMVLYMGVMSCVVGGRLYPADGRRVVEHFDGEWWEDREPTISDLEQLDLRE